MNAPGCRVRYGTRESRLAVVQSNDAVRRLHELLPDATFEQVTFSSPGDRDRTTDLKTSPADFFTRDLDDALRRGDIDCAVHSAKDLPEPMPEDIDWFWLPWREDPRDVLIRPPGLGLDDLPAAPRIGVSSDRRERYALSRFPGARLMPIRGNIEQRLAQLDAGHVDLVIMAAAALERLGLMDRVTAVIPETELPPPEGQGYLAMTFRLGDTRMQRLRSLFIRAVTFAGAGAGSAGECTVAARDALGRADVCLHDALLDPAVLDFLPASAQRVDVGKRCGSGGPPQDAINAQIALHARRGRRVVRLKGGDPGVFGRLAEELATLDSLALPYRVIPGVSSIQTVSTGTGMLLTRRGISRGFCVITPRLRGGATAPVDAAARGDLPVVVLMGLSTLEQVGSELVDDGHAPGTPCALVLAAGTAEECVVDGTLGGMSALAAAAAEADDGRQLPATLIVGEVVRYRHHRTWGALEGRHVLLTASDALQSRAAGLVQDYGGTAVACPLIRLVPDPAAASCFDQIDEFDWIALTSPSAVRVFMDVMRDAGVDMRRLPRLMVAGAGTARELVDCGLVADLAPTGRFSAASMIAAARDVVRAGERVLRLRSDKAGPELQQGLESLGAQVEDVILYRNQPIPHDRRPRFDAACFASASAVDAFVALWGPAPLAETIVVAIGAPTVQALVRHQVGVTVVAPEATIESSVEALAAWCVGRRLQS